jgi:hypothetical protein
MRQGQEVAGTRVSRKVAEELLDEHEYSLAELACRLETSQVFLEQEVWHCRLKAIRADDEHIRIKRPDALSWLSRIESEQNYQGVELSLIAQVHSGVVTSGHG